MERGKARRILNTAIAVTVLAAWVWMLFWGQGTLSQNGIGSLKYFTIQSNILAGIAAAAWLGYGEKAERLKYVAAVAVMLTFVVVMGFLGPLYGYPFMFEGPNFFLHGAVPLAAAADVIWLSDHPSDAKDNLLALLLPLLYGIFYVANVILGPEETSDWYLFFHWGWGIGAAIIGCLVIVTWLLGWILRTAQRRAMKR